MTTTSDVSTAAGPGAQTERVAASRVLPGPTPGAMGAQRHHLMIFAVLLQMPLIYSDELSVPTPPPNCAHGWLVSVLASVLRTKRSSTSG